MFTKKPRSTAGLEEARTEALKVLGDLDPTDPQYTKTLAAVETLSNLIAQEAPDKLSINAVVPVVGTLASVVMIIGHEKANVLTTKALLFLPKLLK